jgi:hypothetical protein
MVCEHVISSMLPVKVQHHKMKSTGFKKNILNSLQQGLFFAMMICGKAKP